MYFRMSYILTHRAWQEHPHFLSPGYSRWFTPRATRTVPSRVMPEFVPTPPLPGAHGARTLNFPRGHTGSSFTGQAVTRAAFQLGLEGHTVTSLHSPQILTHYKHKLNSINVILN